MRKLRVLIVEDEIIISMNLVTILESLEYEVLEPATSYKEAVEILERHKPDIALLDIQLGKGKNGIDLANFINSRYEIPFIFLTSNADNATLKSAKETNPASYLVKPFNQDDLFTSIELAIHNFKQISEKKKTDKYVLDDSFFVKNKSMFYKVKYEEILFLKSDHVYIELYTTNKKKHLIRGSLTSFSEKLPSNFYRTHRSYVVNLNYLEAINSVNVVLQGEQVPIGKTFRTDLMSRVRIE